jgi:hypothetical protein
MGNSLSRLLLRPRARYVLGLSLSLLLVVAGSALAYSGAMPRWLVPGNMDKVLHFSMAATLVFFADGALGRRALFAAHRSPPLAAVVVLVPLGVEEYLQRLSQLRTSSIWDFAADLAGVALGILASRRVSLLARGRCQGWT